MPETPLLPALVEGNALSSGHPQALQKRNSSVQHNDIANDADTRNDAVTDTKTLELVIKDPLEAHPRPSLMHMVCMSVTYSGMLIMKRPMELYLDTMRPRMEALPATTYSGDDICTRSDPTPTFQLLLSVVWFLNSKVFQ